MVSLSMRLTAPERLFSLPKFIVNLSKAISIQEITQLVMMLLFSYESRSRILEDISDQG